MVEIIIGLEDAIGKELEKIYLDNNIAQFIPVILKFYEINQMLHIQDQTLNRVHPAEWYDEESLRRTKNCAISGYFRKVRVSLS